MMARGRSRERHSGGKHSDSRSKSKGKKPKAKCWHCGKAGHLKKDCWKRKQADKEGSSEEKKEANTTDTGSVSGMSDEVLSVNASKHDQHWLLDFGASNHMCIHKDWFKTYRSIDDGVVYMGNDVTSNIVGIGSIQLQMFDGTTKILTDVRHVPDLRKNLISLGALDSNGYKNVIQGGVMKIYKGILLVMKAKKVGNLFQLEGRTGSDHASVSEHDSSSIHLWHQRLGHMSERGLKILADRKLLPNLRSGKLDFCKHCLFGKQSKQKFKTGKHTSKGILDYIHSDVWGPAPTASFGGSSYFVSFIDDFSRKVWVFMLKKKSDVFSVFKQFRALVENNTGRTIKCLRTGNGGEFTSKEFDSYCKDAGIERHKTTVYTPQQNGVAKRMNRTLLERARCMLSNAGLPKELWTEAVATACYVINRSPSKAIDCKVPQEVWKGHPCDYSKLRVFGCDAYALVPKHQRTKLDPKSKRYIFVGYGDGTKGFRLWDPTTRKIIINRDVRFNESSLVQLDVDRRLKQDDVSDFQHIQFDSFSNDSHNDHSSDSSHEEGSDGRHEQVSDSDHEEVPTEDRQSIVEAPETSLRRSTRIKRRPRRYDDSVALIANDDEPLCYQKAVEGSNSDKWKAAMKEEMMALSKNGTWDLVELPKGRKTVGCKWVFKLKRGVNDTEDRYKARLVAKGFSQKAGIDFHEIFSPVVKIVSIRNVLALVALFDLELQQLDVKTAFLHGDLDEEIYMEQPEGFVQHRNAKFVCRLKKSLYGLKQSPRQWYKKFDSFMLSQKYVRIEYDHCVYFKQLNNGMFIILVLYVDDMLLASKSIEEINRLKTQMARTFDMKDLGAARQILGMEIFRDRDNGKLWPPQHKYVEKILLRFGMNNVKPVLIPLASHFKLSSSLCPNTDEEKDYMSRISYANVVGCLMYAMVCTRQIFLMHLGLSAGDLDKRRSTSGYVFTLVGGAISWMSKLQKIVALSTTEAEYIAASHACKEAVWLKGLLGEFGRLQDNIRLLCDSQSAIHLAKNPAYHSKSKHIPIKYHFVRQVITERGVSLEKVHTKENCADMFTKPVLLEKLRWCLASLGLQER
eukprot:PITA_34717